MKIIKKLSELEEGTPANVISVKGSKDFQNDIMDHGILPGRELQISKKYDFAEKIVIKMDEIEIALRYNDANFIEVEFES